jgi:tight adherence protein C
MMALMAPAGVSAQQGYNLEINQVRGSSWPDVTLNITLTGPDGRAVPDLNAAQFEVREQGAPQTLVGLELGPAKSVPLALVMVIDVSGSMNAEGKMGSAKEAANGFIGSLRPEDETTLLAFNDQVRTVVPATADKGALQAGVNSLQASGETAIYDATYRAAQILAPVKGDKRRAIVLLTDGADTASSYSARTAADVAQQSGALLYTIGLGAEPNGTVLTALAEPTGGKYYPAPSTNDLAAIYNAISLELDSQLFLRYKSATQVQRSYQLVTVEVKYTAPDGQIVSKAITYRPPPAAVVPAQVEPAVVPTLLPRPNVVPLPEGIGTYRPPPPPSYEVPFPVRLASLGAALLASISALCGAIGLAVLFTPSVTRQRMATYVATTPSTTKEDKPPGFVTRVLVPLSESVGRRLARLSPRGYTEHIEQLLTLTGPPYRMQLGGFLGIQFALAILFTVLLVVWALQASPGNLAQLMLSIILGLAMGLYFPYFWLKRRVTNRRKALLKALPGALDFLAINVEAGLGFDAALNQVVQRWRNSLTDEFALLLIDFQIGKTRKDAWRDLIQRTQVPELNTFVTAMLQNEQIGSSIGMLLRTQADQMRVRRRQAAEEAARTAPVKMLLPMVFFIFPGMFVVILGPAVPQFLNAFGFLGQ